MHFRFLTRFCLATILLAAAILASETAYGDVDLTPHYRRGQLVRVSSVYEVVGSLTVSGPEKPGSEKPTNAPLAVSATSRYDERLLAAEARSSSGDKRVPPARRSVRSYSPIEAKLVINGEEIRPTLRADRSLISVSLVGDTLTMHSPGGALTREELDLVKWPADSLAADALLPSRTVAVGDKWQVDDLLLAALLNIGSVGQGEVTAELMEANGDFARIEAAGVVHGTVDGAATTVDITSRCYFDVRRHTVQSLQLVLTEKRQMGEVTPGVDATSKIKVKFTPIIRSEQLSDRALISIDLEAKQPAMGLEFVPASGGYKLRHDRDWHVTKDDRKTAILRNIENGDVLGQCNITNLPVIRQGKQVTLKVFQDDVQKTLGKSFGQFVNTGEFADQHGQLVYHVEAVGKVVDVPIRWRYYLVAKTDGRRTALVFTMEEQMAERFGEADRSLLAGLELLAVANQTPSPSNSEAQAKGDVTKPPEKDEKLGAGQFPSRQRVGRTAARKRTSGEQPGPK